MKSVARIVLLFCLILVFANIAHGLECVEYARMITGINIHGNANTWWGLAPEQGYSRGSSPELRSVLCFPAQGTMNYGHVAVVADIISSSEIIIDHANWYLDGKVNTNMSVTDVSGGNWTRVTVGNRPTEYNVSGFIYDDFVRLCILQVPYDADRCDGADIDFYLECRDTSLCDMHDLGGCQLTEPGASGDPNPYTQSTDIHINYSKIRSYKKGTWHHEVNRTMTPGQTFQFELEGKVENQSNYDLEDVDIDYCFVKDDKDFDVSEQNRRCPDDDHVDIKEGERVKKHSRRSWVTIASDLSVITVATDGRSSFNLPITQENISNEEITLYFYLDVETENEEDRDVSNESKTDEYTKLEIHLDIPNPPPGSTLNLFVDDIHVVDAKNPYLSGNSVDLEIQVAKSGLANLTGNPQITYLLYGPSHVGAQTLSTVSASKDTLNSAGNAQLEFSTTAPATEGVYNINICVDPQDYIDETGETDNCEAVHFIVKGRDKKCNPATLLFFNGN